MVIISDIAGFAGTGVVGEYSIAQTSQTSGCSVVTSKTRPRTIELCSYTDSSFVILVSTFACTSVCYNIELSESNGAIAAETVVR